MNRLKRNGAALHKFAGFFRKPNGIQYSYGRALCGLISVVKRSFNWSHFARLIIPIQKSVSFLPAFKVACYSFDSFRPTNAKIFHVLLIYRGAHL